ncbi:MAG: Gfo/Idh/MocA family protein [Anaerolineae bacterium]
MKVGIVGAGGAAKFHYECLQRIYGVQLEVVGVTSLRAESREAFAHERGIVAFASYDELLEAVEVVDVCSPPYAHADQLIQAAEAGKHVIVEKPFTGYFGPALDRESFRAHGVSRDGMLEETVAVLTRIASSVRHAGVLLGYAENFVYAPAVQKEREIIAKSQAQILRMIGEESHNGSASPVYGMWRYAGGGSLIGKGVHPLGGILYLKRVEGMARLGRPIRPVTVSSRVHEITRLPNYEDKGYLRTDYDDIEDYGWMHIVFEDGTIADVVTSELVLGGIYDWIEVFANNHRVRCHISPTELAHVYTPAGKEFRDIYLMEKVSTQEGWSDAAPDENWTMGYQSELQDFFDSISAGCAPQSDLGLAIDNTLTVYAAYVSAENHGVETEIPVERFPE